MVAPANHASRQPNPRTWSLLPSTHRLSEFGDWHLQPAHLQAEVQRNLNLLSRTTSISSSAQRLSLHPLNAYLLFGATSTRSPAKRGRALPHNQPQRHQVHPQHS
jgi:hypothetical protein